jgi:DNA-binding FadR family transcriptional regulator
MLRDLYHEQLNAALQAGDHDGAAEILRDLASLSDAAAHDPVRDLRAALIEIGTIWK